MYLTLYSEYSLSGVCTVLCTCTVHVYCTGRICNHFQTLCLSAAVLFYVMTRDKLNTEWDNNGAGECTELYMYVLVILQFQRVLVTKAQCLSCRCTCTCTCIPQAMLSWLCVQACDHKPCFHGYVCKLCDHKPCFHSESVVPIGQ